MKKFLSLILASVLIFSGCVQTQQESATVILETEKAEDENKGDFDNTETTGVADEEIGESNITDSEDENSAIYDNTLDFDDLNDKELLRYIEDDIYANVVQKLNSDKYFVENISTAYVSQEYLDELEFNSQPNIYFGYTLEELDDVFQDTRYVFTLGDENDTIVTEFEEYDNTYDEIIKNVAIGTGVILLCITVSVVADTTAPAISMIFALSAKDGTIIALSSGMIGGVAAGITTGIQTGDMEQALKAAALAGSEEFKWGAISGAIAGGAEEVIALKGATLNGLSINEAAKIQKESKYPLDLIKQLKSYDEYEIYKNAGLYAKMVNGRTALVRDIDLKYASELDGKMITNLERMKKGYPPIDPVTGKPYQLHHINQNPEGTLAVLTAEEHLGNPSILNTPGKTSEIDRSDFAPIRKAFWQKYAAGL